MADGNGRRREKVTAGVLETKTGDGTHIPVDRGASGRTEVFYSVRQGIAVNMMSTLGARVVAVMVGRLVILSK